MSESPEKYQPVGVMIGANVRDLRKGRRWTQVTLAAKLSTRGLNWKRTHVADLESGRRETIDLGTLVTLAFVLGVPLARLLEGEGHVLLSPKADWPEHGATARADALRAALSGGNDWMIWPVGRETLSVDLRRIDHELRDPPVQIERELAEELGVDPSRVIHSAAGLWGLTLAEERNRRVKALGDLSIGERQARQGHITRELKAALTKWVLEGEESGDHGGDQEDHAEER
ncbi:helix-turn-helix domain-containing protein [Streptomyces sp. NPDC059906]|uniref:helix-turn-helix domain-containing protein n=1 Tax=Streptomyces sp. NPDC059906 TaxID=3346997 RepID=UPI003650ED01